MKNRPRINPSHILWGIIALQLYESFKKNIYIVDTMEESDILTKALNNMLDRLWKNGRNASHEEEFLAHLANHSINWMRGLEQRINKIEAALAKFDRTKYDHSIFDGAILRHKMAKGYDKHYGRCLLKELKSRKIATKGYEDTEEFLNYLNAFKKYRSNRVKSSSPKK
jgi:hypothetical protein